MPHAQIYDIEVKNLANGYELWISCASRGIAVLSVTTGTVGVESHTKTEPAIALSGYPNPFKESSTISFSLPQESNASLAIFDINGKVVRNLAHKFYPKGKSSVVWDGNTDNGNPVPPGVYLCRISAGDQSESVRVIVQ